MKSVVLQVVRVVTLASGILFLVSIRMRLKHIYKILFSGIFCIGVFIIILAFNK